MCLIVCYHLFHSLSKHFSIESRADLRNHIYPAKSHYPPESHVSVKNKNPAETYCSAGDFCLWSDETFEQQVRNDPGQDSEEYSRQDIRREMNVQIQS